MYRALLNLTNFSVLWKEFQHRNHLSFVTPMAENYYFILGSYKIFSLFTVYVFAFGYSIYLFMTYIAIKDSAHNKFNKNKDAQIKLWIHVLLLNKKPLKLLFYFISKRRKIWNWISPQTTRIFKIYAFWGNVYLFIFSDYATLEKKKKEKQINKYKKEQ